MKSGWPGSTTSPGRASTSITRPVTGALTRTSCSSLNCAFPVVSSTAMRVRYSGWTMVTGFFGAAPAAGATGGWEDLASPHPAARAVTRMMARVRMSLLQRAANGGLELIERGVVVAERAVVVQRLLAIGPLGVEVVQQSHAAS